MAQKKSKDCNRNEIHFSFYVYLEHGPIEFGDARGMGLVEDDESEPAEREHEARGKALHNVLWIRLRSTVLMLQKILLLMD